MFDRGSRRSDAAEKVLGVGHRLIDRAIAEGLGLEASSAVVSADGLAGPLAIFRVSDRVTDTGSAVRSAVVAVLGGVDGPTLLRDGELLLRLNGLPEAVAAGEWLRIRQSELRNWQC